MILSHMSQVQTVKLATNIVDVIGERLKLDRSGANYRGLCPFHGEKSPSFFVNEAMQRYRCFGCGASGDVFEFLENYDGMTFAESLKYLADKAGIVLESFAPTGADAQREKLLEILDLTREYYHYILTEHRIGEPGRVYLKNRGVTQDSIKLFQLGFATPAWDGLLNYLTKKKKYHLSDLEAAGLVVKGQQGRYYDRFRGRLMFPLRNHRGQVVGFSGRVLEAEAKEAKYINSPETSLYHKSDLLFGYSELFREIKKHQKVIVMEGEFDLISSTQAHVNHVVAIKGSALTESQIKLLGRVATQVLLALDGDSAGVKATERAIELIAATNLELRVIDFARSPELKAAGMQGKDPDEIARKNPKLWRTLSDQTISAYDFLMQSAFERFDAASPAGRKQIIDALAPVLGRITHAVEQDYYIQKLAEGLNVRADLVAKDITRFANQKVGPKFSTTRPEPPGPKALTKRQQLEQYSLYLLLHAPVEKISERAELLLELGLAEMGSQPILEALMKKLKTSQDFEIGKFAESLGADLQAQLFFWFSNPLYEKNGEVIEDTTAEWQTIAAELKKLAYQRELQEIQTQLEALDHLETKTKEQEAEISKLLEKIVLLQQKQRL